jgi:hypothetical protein
VAPGGHRGELGVEGDDPVETRGGDAAESGDLVDDRLGEVAVGGLRALQQGDQVAVRVGLRDELRDPGEVDVWLWGCGGRVGRRRGGFSPGHRINSGSRA